MRWVVLIFVALLALDHYTNHLSRAPGIDFYQYWAVPQARSFSPELGSPYCDVAGYVAVLAELAEASADERLKAVTEYRAEPGFASDPLLYVLGGWLPADYTLALRLYQLLQVASLALALALLAWRARLPWVETASLGLLMYVFYLPVLSELRVLNTNAFQLAAVASALALLGGSWRRPQLTRCVALGLLVLVAFLKPLWAPLVALAAVHLLRREGWRACLVPVAGALAFAGALLAWPMAVFGGGIWGEWYNTVFAADPGLLVYSTVEGNRSTPLILSQATGWSMQAWTVLLTASLALSHMVVLLVRRGAPDTPSWKAVRNEVLGRVARRPERIVGLGIAALLALSPLVWWHYYTLALVPLFALLGARGSRVQWALAGVSLLLASGRLGPVYAWFGDADWATIVGVGLAWAPLWIGLLLPGRRPPETFVTE